MRNNLLDFPHPVLNEFSKDYIASNFTMTVVSTKNSGDELLIKLKYSLSCAGLQTLIVEGKAAVIVRVTCYRTSLRKSVPLNADVTELAISKSDISEAVEIEPWIIIKQDTKDFKLAEFNSDYFGSHSFNLKKGMVLAVAQGIRIKLNTIIEKNLRGIINITTDKERDYYHVSYPKKTVEEGTLESDYITIYLSCDDYSRWHRLKNSQYQKNGVERFLQCSLLLPVVVDALNLLKCDEANDEEDKEYQGTIWADSIYSKLRQYGIESLEDCDKSCAELANLLLNNISTVSMMELEEKMISWSQIPIELED